MPESQLSLNNDGALASSSWLASCLKRFPGLKVASLSAAEGGGACRREEHETGSGVNVYTRRRRHEGLIKTDKDNEFVHRYNHDIQQDNLRKEYWPCETAEGTLGSVWPQVVWVSHELFGPVTSAVSTSSPSFLVTVFRSSSRRSISPVEWRPSRWQCCNSKYSDLLLCRH